MKIAFLMGRGVEGCGVTKFALEQARWYERHGHDVELLAVNDKTWSRKNSHPGSENIKLFKLGKDGQTEAMISALSQAEIVYLVSLPSLGHPEKCIANFSRVLQSIQKALVFIQLDHNILSIKRNACLDEAVEAADVIFSLSRNNPFCEYIQGEKNLASLLEEPKHLVYDYQVGFDFDPIKKRFWKDIKEQDPKHHKWIGRTTQWKGYKPMLDFHNGYLMPGGHLTTLEGIEKSPAYLDFRVYAEFESHLSTKDAFNVVDISDKHGKLAQVFSIYENDEMLERMSRVGFGYQLTKLDPKYIERALEFTHCEIICTGTVPVFRKEYGENAISRVTGDPLIQCKDTGTVWFDTEDFPGTFQTLQKLSENPSMRDEHRNAAYEFYKQHQDAEYVFQEMHDKVIGEINGKA